MDEHQEFYSLYLPQLIAYVVPVVQWKGGGIEVGSGVLLNVSGRHFIATAKHCIDAKVRAIRSTNPFQQSGTTCVQELHILNLGWHDTLDIGYLEIADPECPELGLGQLSYDRIVGGRVQFVGFPEVLTEAVSSANGRLTDISLCAGTFGTTLETETDARMEFDFPTVGTKYDPATGGWKESPFPETPRGFSGGACFGVVRPASGPVLRVEYKLLGIQYAWVKERRVVRVVRIKQWCELLHRHGYLVP